MLDTKPSFTCDGCGVRKGETNHWFVALDACRDGGSMAIGPWTEAEAQLPDSLHLCGEACAHKALS